MNTERLYELIRDCSVQCRTGPAVTVNGEEATDEQKQALNDGDFKSLGGGVVEMFAMPHVSEVQKGRPDMTSVDMVFIDIAVDETKAKKHRDEIVSILNEYPDMERLKGGPSYIELGATVGDQGLALQLMAVGSVLGLWDIISGKTMGMTDEQARDAAGVGFLLISGYSPNGKTPCTA
jgi:hypothetical protein